MGEESAESLPQDKERLLPKKKSITAGTVLSNETFLLRPEGAQNSQETQKLPEPAAPGNHEMRRDFQIRKVAHERGISLEAYSKEPAVQALVTVIKDTQDLALNFTYPRSTYVEQDMGDHSLADRYHASARLLNAGALAILDEGFPKQMWDHSVYKVGLTLSGTLHQYGLEITKSSEPNAYHNLPEVVHSPPDGAWHDPQAADNLRPPSGDHAWWNSRLDPDDLYDHPEFPTDPILPEEKQEWLQRCHQESQRLGLPEENMEDPRVIHFLAQLSDARRLLDEQNKCREITSQPEGLSSSVRDRITAASHITQAVIMMLEDGVGTKPPLSPVDLARELNQATKPYGWQVSLGDDRPQVEQQREAKGLQA
ncbi:hypothetical protein [Kitasatospora sp. NPDC005856]|uniref:hypothetical protein n=1 Tax=Kitasatospora sp. NPDC005856 TaxID=3154566 RepID=UPI0033C27969